MSCKYFTINARNKPEILLEKKQQNKRELLRFLKKSGTYKITSELKDLIESKLCETWSPEQIAERKLQFII